MKKILLILLSLCLLLTACTPIKTNEPETTAPAPLGETKKEPIIGAWINYNEIKALIDSVETDEAFNALVLETVEKLKAYKVNQIFLHARAFDDAFYNSKIFPVSEYCSNGNGELKFDVLRAFCEAGAKSGVKIHAWINPYRVRKDGDTSKLSGKPLEIFNSGNQNQELIITEESIFYNPASLNAQSRILAGVREILESYPVAGIHIDDYFYPAKGAEIDSIFYKSYSDSGGTLSLSDYRRECVNSMVSSVYSEVKGKNPDLVFSISPSANIEANYSNMFADVKLWSTREGYCDWIIPQIYFGFNHEKAPFAKLLEDWKKINPKAELIIGIALYKSGKEDKAAGKGAGEWVENKDVTARQIDMLLKDSEVSGFVYYSGSYLYNNISADENNSIKNLLNQYMSLD